MRNRKSVVLSPGTLDEIDERQTLTVGISIDQGFVGGNRWRLRGTGSSSNLRTEVIASQGFPNSLKGKEKEGLIFLDWTPDGPAKLLAMKIGERFTIRGVGSQPFEPLKIEEAAMNVVGTGLGNHVNDATCSATEFGTGSGRDYLKFFYCLECDINRGTLAAKLFAEKSVVVVTAIQTDYGNWDLR